MVGPVLRFAGRFHFQMPEANNSPSFNPSPFDPGKSLEEILPETGCDPADYFSFEFRDCSVRTAIDGQGRVLASNAEDPAIGAPVELKGFMVDVSPSAICAVIHAAELRIGLLAAGAMEPAFQSDLRYNVRPVGFNDVTAAAYYAAGATLVPQNGQSAVVDALGAGGELEIGIHLNRFQKALDREGNSLPNGLTGDVYGYIRPRPVQRMPDGLRLANRRFVAHPNLGASPAVERLFLTDLGPEGPPSIRRIMDIDGYYDVEANGDWIALRPLDFIPFLDFAYATPTSTGAVKQFILYATTPGGEVEIGRFRGDRAEMLASGGLIPFRNPGGVSVTDRLAVDVVDGQDVRHNLMIETEWDLELAGPRGITLGSLETQLLRARVTRNNRPQPGIVPALAAINDTRSPTVADIALLADGTDADGTIELEVRARDLANLGGIEDPVTGAPVDSAPMHRQYGSKALVSIPNPLRRATPAVEMVELCIRVLPKVDPAAPPEPVSYARDVAPLLAYFNHMFPWLHTRRVGGGYRRFLDLADPNSVGDEVDEIIRRLELPSQNRRKMPRSRDAPIGLSGLLARWRDEGFAP